MYTKLAIRNARRSYRDYLLYMITLVILSAIMMFSNVLAIASNQNGIQASSIPLLISIVMMALFNYINRYMLRHRSREFATYMLLGMKKSRIAAVFFGESLLLGAGGLLIGSVLGGLCFPLALSFLREWFPIAGSMPAIYVEAFRNTCLCFVVVQVVSLLGSIRKIRTLQITGLLSEERVGQKLKTVPKPRLWTAMCAVSMATNLMLVLCITSGNEILMLLGTNTLIFSLVFGVWAFYKAAFHWLAWLRQNRRSALYRGNRLYFVAQLLSRITSNILLNTVLCVCLLFSVMTFSVGLIMPGIPAELFSVEAGAWMSFAEMCLSIVFIVIYFSILAVRQVIESRESRGAFRILAYLGKNNRQRRRMVQWEIIVKYAFPAVMCFAVLLICIWPVNSFLNSFLLTANLLCISVGSFFICFIVLYAAYTFAAYRLCARNIK